MASNAELLFERLSGCANPEEVLQAIKDFPEHEFCECKTGKIGDSDAFKHWSKALSGFANTAGGVLIWGIDVRERGTDKIRALELCDDPAKLQERLRACILEAVEPTLDGILYKIVSSASGGLLLCFIPEGVVKPYAGRKQFHMRVVDKFPNIPLPLLRALFYPQQRTALTVEVTITGQPDGTGFAAAYSATLKNQGNVSASELFCRADTSLPLGWSFQGSIWHPAKGYQSPAATFHRPLHPDAEIPLGFCGIGSATADGNILNREYLRHTELFFRVYSLNQEAVHGKVVFEPEDVKLGSKKIVHLEPWTH
jgi:hypothetical protein